MIPKISFKKIKTCPLIWQRSFRNTFTAVNPFYSISHQDLKKIADISLDSAQLPEL